MPPNKNKSSKYTDISAKLRFVLIYKKSYIHPVTFAELQPEAVNSFHFEVLFAFFFPLNIALSCNIDSAGKKKKKTKFMLEAEMSVYRMLQNANNVILASSPCLKF